MSSDVLTVLEQQRQGIGALQEELIRSQERQAQLEQQITAASRELQELGITSPEQVQALETEANELAGQVAAGLEEVRVNLEAISG
jgi:septation ring formation regulator EzrA